MAENSIMPHGILKNLNFVLKTAKQRFSSEYLEQEVVLSDSFKIAFRNYLLQKHWDITYFDHTAVVTSNSGNNIYVANQWFVIASYFVDFCAEMISYKELFISICRNMGMPHLENIKAYTTKIRSNPTLEEKDHFLRAAKTYLISNYANVNDDYDAVANYLWKFGSDYNWWSGNKTLDRHDFFLSPLLNQMNVVNANSEFLGLICIAYASILKLRILVDHVDNFTIGFKCANKTLNNCTSVDDKSEHFNEIKLDTIPNDFLGISISAASLQRFKNS